nr:reverse transcriptase domain-containing protein [Tanacetum cinerariifolium]
MANTTPIVTTVTKLATNPRDADATPRVNIQDFCEEYYEDILPIIMDMVRRDKRKDVHARLDFGKGSRERRTREDSHYSSARSLTARPERLKVRDRLRYSDRHVLDRLGHRRQSAFDRLSETYLPSTTKSRPGRTNSRDHPRGRSRPHRLDTSNEGCPKDRERFRSIGESYDDSHSHSYHDRDRSRHMKRRRDSESPLSSVSKSDSSDRRYRKSKSKRHKHADKDDLTRPWMCETEDPFTPRIRNFKSSRITRMPNNVKTYDGTGDPEDHVKNFHVAAQVERWAMPTWCHMFNSTLIGSDRVWFDELPPESIDSYKDLKAAFLAYFMQQKKYVKDPGAPECMRISEFMHGVNNPELTKRLNEHVPKTMEEMMITTTAFIRGEAAVASKKKGHESWKTQDQSKRFTPLQRHQKKFSRPRQIEELVRTGKLSHLIKEIKHGRDQSMVGKKETPAKDKPMAIYMIQSCQRMTRQKVTQSFKRVREITFRPLTTSNGAEGPLVIEAEIGGHMIHRINNLSHHVDPAECATVITSSEVPKETRVCHENFKVALDPNFPDQEVAIGGTLSAKGHTELCSLLKENLDIFAWQPSDMTGVPRSVVKHRLNIREGYSLVRQKKRGRALERAKAIQAEVQKLVEAGIMRE